MRAAAALLALLLLAGCIAAPPRAAAPVPDGPEQAAAAVPGDRPTLGAIHFHEADNFTAYTVSPNAVVASKPAPRDVDLTYHGVVPTYDEFGRPVPAYLFRFPDEVLMADASVGAAGVGVTHAHYEARLDEYAFDRADARFMGIADVAARARGFVPPGHASPLAGAPTLLMAVLATGGDLARPLPSDNDAPGFNRTTTITFTRDPGRHPLPGDCVQWAINQTVDPPFPHGASDDVVAADPPRDLVCLRPGETVPLWVWLGTRLHGAYSLVRTGPDFRLPALEGTRLPALQSARAAWRPVGGPLPLPSVGPTLVPPSLYKSDWADRLAQRVQALYLEPTFLKYRAVAGDAYVPDAFMAMPIFATSLLGIPLGPHAAFDSMTFLDATDGKAAHAAVLYTRNGSAEQPDTHVAQPGNDHGEQFHTLAARDLPRLVPAGSLQAQFADLLRRTDEVWFSHYPPDAAQREDGTAWWAPLRRCGPTHDGFAALVEAQRGFMMAVAAPPASSPQCQKAAQDPFAALAGPRLGALAPTWPLPPTPPAAPPGLRPS